MPLTLANIGEERIINRIGGKDDTKSFLKTLGFVVGGNILVVAQMNGNMIVNVKDSRVAISKELANKIQV